MSSFSETTLRYVPGLKSNGVSYSHNGLKYIIGVFSFLMIILISSNVYLHVKIYQLSQQEHQCQCVSDAPVNEQKEISFQDVIQVHKRNSARRLQQNTRRKNRRNARGRTSRRLSDLEIALEHLKGAMLKPVVRLPAINDSNALYISRHRILSIKGCERGCFRWEPPQQEYSTSFRYIYDNSHNRTMVVGIQIRRPGIYMIYAQIAVNGPRQGYEPAVGFETIRVKDQNTDPEVLLRSYITQDERGRRYPLSHNGNQNYEQHPHDTMSHMSAFKLDCDDIIIVRKRSVSNDNEPKYVFDHVQAYFGLTLINPTDSSLSGNYAC